jgi:tryptophanyl-tRNA synthetase
VLISETQYQDYKEGKLLTGEVKQILIKVLREMVERHKRARALVTEEVCTAFSIYHGFVDAPVNTHTHTHTH